MADILIRDVPDNVIAAIDSQASAMGLSRSEYLRRRLSQDAHRAARPVAVADLQNFTSLFSDLGNSDVMGRAWS